MDETTLMRIGLNRNEATVYLALVKRGTASAGELIKLTEFHRNIVYDNIEKLVDKGLVSYIIEGRKKVFHANPPGTISDMLEKEQRALDEKMHVADKIKKQVSQYLAAKKEHQEAMIFRGIKGMKQLLQDTITGGNDYYVFGAPQVSVEIMGSAYWKNYNLKREERKIIIKMVFNEDLREWSKNIKSTMTKIRFLPKKFDSLTETMIYGDKVAIIVWTEKPIATVIRDRNLAHAYKKYFGILWKEAKI